MNTTSRKTGDHRSVESWLVSGARTLALRLERAQHNAMTLAERLARHPNVTLTRYPGLASHPTHDAARRQLKRFGTIISFDVLGDAAVADAVCTGLQLIQHATSLGAVERRSNGAPVFPDRSIYLRRCFA